MDYMLDTNICICIMKKHPFYAQEKFKKIPIGSVSIVTNNIGEFQRIGHLKLENWAVT